jgi:hypothetical protein
LFAECDSDFSVRRQSIRRHAHHDEALVDIFAGGLNILLVLVEVEFNVLQLLTPSRGIVLQSRRLMDHCHGNRARAQVLYIQSCFCHRRSLHAGR